MDHTTIFRMHHPVDLPGPFLILSRIALRCGLRLTENLKDGTPRGAAEQESMGKTVLNSSVNALMLVEPMTCNSLCLQSSYFVNGPYLNQLLCSLFEVSAGTWLLHWPKGKDTSANQSCEGPCLCRHGKCWKIIPDTWNGRAEQEEHWFS